MTEKQLQNKVLDFLRHKNIWHVKIWGGGFQRAGIPDILCCVNGRFVAIELKAEGGRVSKLQEYNLTWVKESGGIAMVLRPDGYEDFKILIGELLRQEVTPCNSPIRE
jgi:Holliday junction resolvase